MDFFSGTPETREQVSNLTPSQMRIQSQLQNAARKKGAGGAFGDSADYYRSNLGTDPEDFNAFAAPQLRQFREDIMPGLAEQYAGMGASGTNFGNFGNEAGLATTDLGERLAALRAGLRERSAQGLQSIGQQSLTPHTEWQTTQPGSEGFLSSAIPALATAAGTAIGGPAGGAFGNFASNTVKNWMSPKGSTGPYGGTNSPSASPNQGFSSKGLPNFNSRLR